MKKINKIIPAVMLCFIVIIQGNLVFSQNNSSATWTGLCIRANMQNFNDKIFSDYYGKSIVGLGIDVILLSRNGLALVVGGSGVGDKFDIHNPQYDLSQKEEMLISTFEVGIRKYSLSGFYVGGGMASSTVDVKGEIWDLKKAFEYQTRDKGQGYFGVVGITSGKIMGNTQIDLQAKFTNTQLKKTKQDLSNITFSIGVVINIKR